MARPIHVYWTLLRACRLDEDRESSRLKESEWVGRYGMAEFWLWFICMRIALLVGTREGEW